MCGKFAECKREGLRRSLEDRGLKARDRPTPPPCRICGVPTTAESGYCTRTLECRRKNLELWSISLGGERRIVYGILFPKLGILKVGKWSNRVGSPLKSAEHHLKKQGLVDSGIEIWETAGGVREEQFMHAYLAFSYPPAFTKSTRASEWYLVSDVSAEDLISHLDEIAATMPESPKLGLDAVDSAGRR